MGGGGMCVNVCLCVWGGDVCVYVCVCVCVCVCARARAGASARARVCTSVCARVCMCVCWHVTSPSLFRGEQGKLMTCRHQYQSFTVYGRARQVDDMQTPVPVLHCLGESGVT